jgi:glycolate oxidase FAD binding subunit
VEATLQSFADQIQSAQALGQSLTLCGGGSKAFYAEPAQGDRLETSSWRGISAYEPTELVVTVRAGTPLAELEAALDANNQMLAFEPPHFGGAATVGGMVATGLSGPRRAAQGVYAGAVRDAVLGITVMDGRGQVLRFGGQVMKNVAGYDVSRLMVGALGTLGLVLDVSIKVLPKPVASATVRLAMNEALALEKFNQWGGQPLPVTATYWRAGEACVRLEGAEAAVSAAAKKIGGERVEGAEAIALWRALRDQNHVFFTGATPCWRLSVPSTAVPLQLGAALIEWGGAQRWVRAPGDAATAAQFRAATTAVGGHATLFRGGDHAVSVFTPLDTVSAAIHRKLKAQFDPDDVLNRGRMGSALALTT